METARLQIVKVELLECLLKTPSDIKSAPQKFSFEINLEHRISQENNLVLVICGVSILDEESALQYGSIKVGSIYQFESFVDFYNKELESIKIPDQIMVLMNSISISNTRGFMCSVFRGTVLHNALLPMVDPKAFNLEHRK